MIPAHFYSTKCTMTFVVKTLAFQTGFMIAVECMLGCEDEPALGVQLDNIDFQFQPKGPQTLTKFESSQSLPYFAYFDWLPYMMKC